MKRCLLNQLCVFFAFVIVASSVDAQSNIEVDGLGWFGDRKMDQRLAFLLGYKESDEVILDSALLEDAAFLVLEQMRRGGYLQPSILGSFTTATGEVEAGWATPYSVQLPVEFVAESATYIVSPGRLFYYDSVSIDGLEGVGLKDVDRFFIPGGRLIKRKKDLAYTPENFARRKNRLLAALGAIGYSEAIVASEFVSMDEATGAVTIKLVVETGPVYRVGPVDVDVADGSADWLQEIEFSEGVLYNLEWLREARTNLRNAAYAAGYLDVIVQSRLGESSSNSKEVTQPVTFVLKPGGQVRLSGVRFEGDSDTKRSVLKRQVDLEPGALMDLRETDRARRRLLALGIFRQVELNYEQQPDGTREVVYHLVPDTRKELELLTGWGSYEQARAGFRWTHKNPWGRAHRYTLSGKQSLKATRIDADYQVPQMFGANLTGYSEVEYSLREEISYDRLRQGGLVGVFRLLGESGVRLALEYGWFIERADGVDKSGLSVNDDAQVASLALSASLDHRDSVIMPTSGYNLFAIFKIANRSLGGSVDFQKFEIGGGDHFSVSESTIFHLGLRGGVVLGREGNIPFNERFFPGGENSVRGYQQGEATPLGKSGDPVGAEWFWIGNFEIEQRVFSDLSLVAFFDTVGFRDDGGTSESRDLLSSVGLGLRYQTVVGPVRLEYGHNLNPRGVDPDGTLHFSIGFPF